MSQLRRVTSARDLVLLRATTVSATAIAVDPHRVVVRMDADLGGYRTNQTGTSGGAIMRFDNYLVELIPAPSSVALLGLGGLVAARRRRA